ncbi:glycosyltransferase [Planktomarina temperata]|nr:glycosyltransferase [Planktomarina temperata]
MKKISVITVCYNSEKTIKRCLFSVQSQGTIVGEHIIFDGGSTDSTIEIIKSFNPQNYPIKLTIGEDKGVYDALNKAIASAECDWIALLHSDDEFYDSTSLSNMLSKRSHASNVLYANLEMVRSKPVVRKWISSTYSKKKISYGWMPPHPTMIIQTKLALLIGKYDLKYKIASDYEYCIRLFRHPKTVSQHINTFSVKMYIGGLSTSGVSNRFRKNYEDICIMRTHGISLIPGLIGKKLLKIQQYF